MSGDAPEPPVFACPRDTQPLPSASCSASEPASCVLTVASFNFGYLQSMVTGRDGSKHVANFAPLCALMVDTVDADLLFGCEVGDFQKGFSKASIHVDEVLHSLSYIAHTRH